MEEKSTNGSQKNSGRKLTKAEIARKELFDRLTADLEGQGYIRKNITVSSLKANLLGFVAGFVPTVPFGIVFILLTRGEYTGIGHIWYMLFFPIFIASVLIHEGLHGTGWAIFAKGHFKSIAFGVVWQALMPYCTCKDPLRKGQYIVGLLLPCIVLGIIPSVLACIFGSAALLAFGTLMTVCAGGDILVLVLILKARLNGDVLLLDHPTDVGLVAFVRENG